MKKIIVIINLLLIIFLSCTRNDKIKIIDKYELIFTDTLVISHQVRFPSVIINNGYILLFDTQAQSIIIHDSIGNVIFRKDIFGESPGKGYMINQNGVFIKDKIIYIIYSNPPKISKFNLNGEFIEDIKFFVSMGVSTSIINKDDFVIVHLSKNGLEYVILDENNIRNPISEFIVTSDINDSKYQEYFNKNPYKCDIDLYNFSVKDSFLYIPDIYTGLMKIYNLNGYIVDKIEIVDDYSPPPHIDIDRLNEIINRPIPEWAIYPPIFLDSLIIVRVSDKYKNNWEKAKDRWTSFGDPNNENYKDYLYIYNNEFELLDTVGLEYEDIRHIYSNNSLIYITKNIHQEDSSYIIFYRYRLEEK